MGWILSEADVENAVWSLTCNCVSCTKSHAVKLVSRFALTFDVLREMNR